MYFFVSHVPTYVQFFTNLDKYNIWYSNYSRVEVEIKKNKKYFTKIV